MTTFIQSLWTKTPQWKGLTYEHALMLMFSWKCMSRQYPTAAKFFYCDDVELATKLVSEDYAEQLLVPPGTPKHVWAAGKLAALNQAYANHAHVIHVDSDAFLYKPLPRVLTMAPVVAQSPDPFESYHDEQIRGAMMLMGLQPKPNTRAYNAGIIGGARSVMWPWVNDGLVLCRKIPDRIDGTAASMAVEQFRLGLDFPNVHTLFTTSRPNAAQVNQMGYAHWCGPEKKKPERIDALEKKMSKSFPHSLTYLKSLELPRAHTRA